MIIVSFPVVLLGRSNELLHGNYLELFSAQSKYHVSARNYCGDCQFQVKRETLPT